MPTHCVTYTGVTSGSHLGRDDGYPERKVVMVDRLDDAAPYAGKPDFAVYRLEPLRPEDYPPSVRRMVAKRQRDEKVAALSKLTRHERKVLGLGGAIP